MTTYDTTADIIESSVNFALVDPTTVAGRTHRLHNDSASALTVSSTGATPFSSGGVNSATITLSPGQAMNIYSNGTRWVAAGGSTNRQFAAGTAVSTAGGLVNITFPVAFPVPPTVQGQVVAAAGSNAPFYLNLVSVTTTGCQFEVRTSAAITVALIGLTVLVGSTAAVGQTVHWLATQAGATP